VPGGITGHRVLLSNGVRLDAMRVCERFVLDCVRFKPIRLAVEIRRQLLMIRGCGGAVRDLFNLAFR
jgi:hypothetical protein